MAIPTLERVDNTEQYLVTTARTTFIKFPCLNLSHQVLNREAENKDYSNKTSTRKDKFNKVQDLNNAHTEQSDFFYLLLSLFCFGLAFESASPPFTPVSFPSLLSAAFLLFWLLVSRVVVAAALLLRLSPLPALPPLCGFGAGAAIAFCCSSWFF